MIKKFNIIGLLGILILSIGYSQNIQYTKRLRNEVREGPGNYYKLLYVFPVGIPLSIHKKEGNWLNVKVSGTLESSIGGWISKNCLADKTFNKKRNDIELIVKSSEVTSSGIAAAIRGFALRYGRPSTSAIDAFIKLQENLFSPEEYKQFKKQSGFTSNESLQKKLKKYSQYFKEYNITTEEEGVGLGIAADVASNGLVHDKKLLQYVNLLAMLISESSEAFDFPFKVFILADEDLKAISIPGGYIFISNGLLNLCEDEAELAGIIAHEMIHIILQHGLQEIQQRIMNIKMDEIMLELDKETDFESDELSQELEDFVIESYEVIMEPRLQSYEEEADIGAMLLLIKTGYEPRAILDIILKVQKNIKEDEEMEMENPFLSMDFQKRYDEGVEFLRKDFKDFKGIRNKERFLSNLEGLRK